MIRPGDSLPAIAAIFHLPVQDLLRHNHLSPDAILHVGQVLLIPNPYAAQVRDLQSQIDTLRTSTANQVRGLQVQISSLRARNPDWARYLSDYASMAHVFEARNKELSSINAVLEHEVATLQWWRRAAIVAITLAVLMLAITLAVLVVRVPKARNP